MREATRPALRARGASASSSARPAAAPFSSTRKVATLGAASLPSSSSGGARSSPAPPLQRVRAISTEQPPVVRRSFCLCARRFLRGLKAQGNEREKREKSVDLFFFALFFSSFAWSPLPRENRAAEREQRDAPLLCSTSTFFSSFVTHRPFFLRRRAGARNSQNQSSILNFKKLTARV